MARGTLDANGNGPAWRVTRISDVPAFDATTGDRTAKRIDYVLFDGTESYIIVPLAQYQPEVVQKLLDERAAVDAEVSQLQGPSISVPQQLSTPEFGT